MGLNVLVSVVFSLWVGNGQLFVIILYVSYLVGVSWNEVLICTAINVVIEVHLYMFRCRYSQALKPIFDKAAESLHNEHPVSNITFICCYSDVWIIAGWSGTG